MNLLGRPKLIILLTALLAAGLGSFLIKVDQANPPASPPPHGMNEARPPMPASEAQEPRGHVVLHAAEVKQLLELVQQSSNLDEVSEAQWKLAQMATPAMLQEIASRYERAVTLEQGERLALIVARTLRPGLEASLASLAPPEVSVRDVLARAALRALRQQGTPVAVDAFARRLDQAVEADAAMLAETFARFNQPGLQETLIDQAVGKSAATRPLTRLAAVNALSNYHDNFVDDALRKLSEDADPAIAAAAARILNNRP